MVCQYGEWLKSEGRQPHSPSRMGSNTNMHSTNVAKTEVQVGNANPKLSAAKVENTKENPTEDNSHKFGKSVDSGIFPVSTEKASEIERIIMESLGPSFSVSDTKAPNSSWESILHDIVLQHMDMLKPAPAARHVGKKD